MAFIAAVNPIRKRGKKMKARRKNPARAKARKVRHSVKRRRNPVARLAKRRHSRRRNPVAMTNMATMFGGAAVGVGGMLGLDYALTHYAPNALTSVPEKARPALKALVVGGLGLFIAKKGKSAKTKAFGQSMAVSAAALGVYDTAQAFMLDAGTPSLKGGESRVVTDYNYDFSQSSMHGLPMAGTLPATGPLPPGPLGANLNAYEFDDTGNY